VGDVVELRVVAVALLCEDLFYTLFFVFCEHPFESDARRGLDLPAQDRR
jgi:hypothetical protein